MISAAFCAYRKQNENTPSSEWAIRRVRVQGRLVTNRPPKFQMHIRVYNSSSSDLQYSEDEVGSYLRPSHAPDVLFSSKTVIMLWCLVSHVIVTAPSCLGCPQLLGNGSCC